VVDPCSIARLLNVADCREVGVSTRHQRGFREEGDQGDTGWVEKNEEEKEETYR
jgi:hypothetical protein